MIKRRRGDCYCKKYSWFGYIAYQYRKKKIIEEKKRKSHSRGNKFVLLLSKVCRRIKSGYVACPSERKVQPMRCWGCRKEDYPIWGCPNKAA